MILTATFAEFLRNLLINAVPEWSLRLCVFIASGALCASVFLTGFAALGITLPNGTWVMCAVIGLLCARHVLSGSVETMYGDLFFEGAVAWGFWILLAIAREFMGSGMIFGNTVLQTSFQSKIFLDSTFAFLTAGLVLAFTNGILKKELQRPQQPVCIYPRCYFGKTLFHGQLRRSHWYCMGKFSYLLYCFCP